MGTYPGFYATPGAMRPGAILPGEPVPLTYEPGISFTAGDPYFRWAAGSPGLQWAVP
jgi:hypothetical protein